MKRHHLMLIVGLLLLQTIAHAQTKLPDSRKSSANSYIYTIERDDLRKYYMRDKDLTEDTPGQFVTEFPKDSLCPTLPRGNYVIVDANEERLNMTGLTVDDLYYRLVPADEVMLCLYDSLGNIITDAKVRTRGKILRYDKTTQTYNTQSIRNEDVIEINNNGVYHYIAVEKTDNYYSVQKKNPFKTIWWITRGRFRYVRDWVHCLFDPDYCSPKDKYTGFIVFNKPKYKPGETVKFKAYMARHNGKPYDKPVDIRLYNYYPNKIDTVLIRNLHPYRPGMYEQQFELSDGLDLVLDVSYTIELATGNDRYNTITNRFLYEDYELKGINFAMDTDKIEHAKGDSLKLKFKVTDENDMAVYDGKIDLVVTSNPINRIKIKNLEQGFIPDTLWTYTLMLDGLSNRELVLPESIFPEEISIDYQVSATYLSSDNLKLTSTKLLTRKADDYDIHYSLSKGMLTINEHRHGQPQPVMADISVIGENMERIQRKSVMLPYTMPLPWYASEINVETAHAKNSFYLEDVKEQQIEADFYRMNDSIHLKVNNPAAIPFWYNIRIGSQTLARGYTTQLDYAVKDNKVGYGMQISYLLGESGRTFEAGLPFIQKNISMEVNTPTAVYPGQKADVKVTVKDKHGKPAGNVDITAYSFTSKFERYSTPDISIKGTGRYAFPFKKGNYDLEEGNIYHSKTGMTFDRWRQTLSLDTIEYYSFLYPETYYLYTEPTADRTTLISPYVVVDGVLQKVFMLSIDERLYYTSLHDHKDVYTFPVEAGNHKLKFRTYDREISVHNVYIKEGSKNIYSFNVAEPYIKVDPISSEENLPLIITTRQLKRKQKQFPTADESKYLSDHLITIDSNFGTIHLPNLSNGIEIPAYLKSGDIYYHLNPVQRTRFDNTLGGYINLPAMTGPFPRRSTINGIADVGAVYRGNNELVSLIDLEGGNRYTVHDGYQKIKSWDENPFTLTKTKQTYARNFREKPITVDDILQHTRHQVLNAMRNNHGSAEIRKKPDIENGVSCRLELFVGDDNKGNPLTPALIFIVPEDKNLVAQYQLHYGSTRKFTKLPEGKMNVSLVFNDSTTYTRSIHLKPGGKNFLNVDSIQYMAEKEIAGQAFRIFKKGVNKLYTRNPYATTSPARDKVTSVTPNDTGKPRRRNSERGMISGVVIDTYGEPVIGADVRIDGTEIGTITDLNGYFELSGGSKGDKVTVYYIGFINKSIKYIEGNDYQIQIREDSQQLDEIVVVGYGSAKKYNLVGSVSQIERMDLAPGALAGIRIRGKSSLDGSEPPLILLNGLPYNGKMEDIDLADILSINILKDASATAIYGARAANGVIMIQTKNPVINAPADDNLPVMEPGNTMRHNFNDDAFWQPRLTTNAEGEANFEVTYPDDVTSWKAFFIAIGDKTQTDKHEMTINSFKALVASLSTPRFAVRGDSLNAVGRITNHLGDSITVKRKIEKGSEAEESNISLKESYVDYIPVRAENGDSLTLAYSMHMSNGYFDGEKRSLPITEKGMLQTYGEFKVLNDTSGHTFNVDPELGKVTIHAEASSLELFLREIQKVDDYPYMCNEQMASKIKVLLSKKSIAKLFNQEFKEDAKINNLITRLNRNINNEGKWGWWNRDQTETWISYQVIDALLDAQEQGYKSSFDSYELSQNLLKELKTGLFNLRYAKSGELPFAKQELLQRLIILNRLKASAEYEQYVEEIVKQLPDRSVADRLKTMEAMVTVGLKDQVNMDSLMYYSSNTLLGSLLWAEKKSNSNLYRYNLPYTSDTENTLMAYRILKAIGGHEDKLQRIRNYFFERRQGGSWANTYESSRIIETIMPDMLKGGQEYNEVTMSLNGRKITNFPFTEETRKHDPVTISKKGSMPVFVTVYQQAWNPAPMPESSKGFAVKTAFTANGDTISHLKAGRTTQMEVTVNLDGEAEYIQIEVPIPAGCSYDTKMSGNYWKEVHREHFKDKVVIFSNKLTKGEHRFNIQLIPRYTGMYSLNPAKAELMYFPVVYGNEAIKTVVIE